MDLAVTHIHRSVCVVHAIPHDLIVVHQNTANGSFAWLNSLLALCLNEHISILRHQRVSYHQQGLFHEITMFRTLQGVTLELHGQFEIYLLAYVRLLRFNWLGSSAWWGISWSRSEVRRGKEQWHPKFQREVDQLWTKIQDPTLIQWTFASMDTWSRPGISYISWISRISILKNFNLFSTFPIYVCTHAEFIHM